MADVQVEANGRNVKVEALGLDKLYGASLRALKKVDERDATVVKDFDYENAQIAPLVHVACKCTVQDFETMKPQKALLSVLSEMAERGFIKSWFAEPARVVLEDPSLGNGYCLFAMVHMLPYDLINVKSKYPFLLNEGEPMPLWSLEAARVR